MQGSGLYVVRNGRFVELPKRRKKKVDWKFVLLWVCLLLGMLTGFVLNR
jgi:hypothetical protein